MALSTILARSTRLVAEGRLDEAILGLEQAIAIDPDSAEAFRSLGAAYWKRAQPLEAAAMWHRAAAIEPGDADTHTHLGVALGRLGRPQEAEAEHRRALQIDPGLAKAQINLAASLVDQGRFAEAETACAAAIAIDRGVAEYYLFLAGAIGKQGRVEECVATLRKGLTLDPHSPALHHDLAFSLLQGGWFAEGWREYEWRWRHSQTPRTLAFPAWEGQDLKGRTVLLYAEQGFGDIIQFVRYARMLAARGASVIAEVPETLQRLVATVPGVAKAIRYGVDDVPAADYHLAMLSAPRVFATDLDSVPNETPHVSATAAGAAVWAERLKGVRGLKVGLAWSGKPIAKGTARDRSIALARLAPLLSVRGVTMISLQWDDASQQIADLPRSLRPLDWMSEMADFADTAALVENLDLVITIDTSIAHLAGALGKPVWILLRFDACWRWLLGRADSPWYPTARLFRQAKPGDWEPVIEDVARALSDMARTKSASRRAPSIVARLLR